MACRQDEGLEIAAGGWVIGPQLHFDVRSQGPSQLDDGDWAGFSSPIDQVG